MPTFLEISKKFNQELIMDAFINSITDSIARKIRTEIPERIYRTGQDAQGWKLATNLGSPYYSKNTTRIKKNKNQPTDRVTLRDTGKFYKSFRVDFIVNGFEITANFQKKDGNIYRNFSQRYNFNEFKNDITSLNEKEFNNLLEELKPKIIDILIKKT